MTVTQKFRIQSRTFPAPFLATLLVLAMVQCASSGQTSADAKPPEGRNKDTAGRTPRQQPPPFVFYSDVPAHDVDIILGRPTHNAITLSILAWQSMEGFVNYRPVADASGQETAPRQFTPGEPKEIVLEDLTPNSPYQYHFSWRAPGTTDYRDTPPGRFHTQRPPGAPFSFTIQADSHLDHPKAPALYAATLQAGHSSAPDFHIDLGDTFMTDKRRQDFRSALPQYLAQRYYLGQPGQASPLFLVLGNHDGESGSRFNSRIDSMPGWSHTMRTRYFPNPVPNDFYSGNSRPMPPLGLLQDYYAWEWGSALFVVLDPYWYTTASSRGLEGGWERTLGEEQYRWLSQTLLESRAAFRFVFIHNLVGGADASMRGGAEAARYFEWGGRDLGGENVFRAHRPGWAEPVHDLLRRASVDVVFHGHDHFFARQELEGIVYQLVPQPSNPGAGNVQRMAAEYGYLSGDFLPSPGYMKVDVGADTATVSYLQVPMGAQPDSEASLPSVAFQYQVSAGETGPSIQAPLKKE